LYQSSTPCEECHALKCFRTGEAVNAQFSSGEGRVWDLNAFPIEEKDGETTKVIMIYRDVTERANLQAEAMRASHLASLGELSAGVAHEINNPINGIINYAQILVNKSENGDEKEEIANRIIKEGNRITSIVKSLLSFARDRQEDKGPIAIHDIFSDTLALSEMLLRNNGVTLKLDVPPKLPTIIGNSQQIQQVFLNIINNAQYALNRKYEGRDEEKVLEISATEVSDDNRAYLRITFLDRGTGIPAHLLGKVTDPFFSTKPKGQGTGLGLSISHGIITDHEGRMLIESSEGEFTNVVIDLPAATVNME
jgi:signal transduction histidine kinase